MESLEASFGSCLCELEQFEGITVKKQVNLDEVYALGETIRSMPFGCLPVIWKELNIRHILHVVEHKER